MEKDQAVEDKEWIGKGYYRRFFGIVLQGSEDDFTKLKNFIYKQTALKVKFVKSSKHYLLIQPANWGDEKT